MKTFKSYLEEGRDSPLYHITTLANAERILIDNWFTQGAIQEKINGKIMRGVSFTRNHNIRQFIKDHISEKPGISYGYVVMVIDQRRLAQRYKIIPYNYGGNSPWRNNTRYSDPHKNEYEEFVPGDIKNAKSFITKILLDPVAQKTMEGPMKDNFEEVDKFPHKGKL